MTDAVERADEVASRLIELAKAFPNQPAAVICDEKGQLQAGVLAIYRPNHEDWFFDPVALSSLPDVDVAAILK